MIASLTSNNGYAFGLRWSLLGCLIALFYITSCELLVPPDRSVPRYNTVQGAKKRPILNPGGAGFEGENSTNRRVAAMEYAYGETNAPIQSTSAMPVAPLPAAPVAAPRPAQAVSSAQPSQEKGFWSSMAFWRGDEVIADAPLSARRRPTENANAAGTVAAATAVPVASAELQPLPGSYPELNATPEKPGIASIDNSRQRSMAMRNELEADRVGAMQARDDLARDATAEPSLLSNPPPATQPRIGALPPPPAMNAAQAATVAAVTPAASEPLTIRAPIQSNGSAFERLTQKPLTATTTNSATAMRPRSMLPSFTAEEKLTALPTAMEPITLTPPAVKTSGSLQVPADTSTPLTPAPFASVNVNAAPAVAGIGYPAATGGAIEPIRLVPPSSMMGAPAAPAQASGTATTTAFAQPATTQRSIANQNYLPGSRYTQRRR